MLLDLLRLLLFGDLSLPLFRYYKKVGKEQPLETFLASEVDYDLALFLEQEYALPATDVVLQACKEGASLKTLQQLSALERKKGERDKAQE